MRPMNRPSPTRWNVQAQQQQQEGDNTPPPAAPAAPAAPAEPTGLTQAQVDSIVGREKATTEAATKKAIADQLGVTLDEAAAIIKAAKDRDEAEKSEAQKARDAADKEKGEAESAKSAAAAAKHELDVIRALARAGVPIVAIDEKTGLASSDAEAQKKVDAKLATMAKLVEAEVGADAATIDTAVTALKDTMPELFAGAAPAAPKPKVPGKTPATDPKVPAAKATELNEDAMSRGAARAQAAGARQGYAWETPAAGAASS